MVGQVGVLISCDLSSERSAVHLVDVVFVVDDIVWDGPVRFGPRRQVLIKLVIVGDLEPGKLLETFVSRLIACFSRPV